MSIKRIGLLFAAIVAPILIVVFAPKGSGVSAQGMPSYFPLSTSTPLVITDSATPTTVIALWTFEATSSSCNTSASNLLTLWENDSSAAASLFCNGSLGLSGGLGVDGQSAPSSGFACGTGSLACSFSSGAAHSAPAAFSFNTPSCTGGLNDIVQFQDAGTPVAWVECNGFFTGGNGKTSIFAGVTSPYSGIVQAWDGAVISTADGKFPTLSAGWIVGETSPTSGALILGGIDGNCRLDFGTITAGTMTVGCPFQATAAFQADGITNTGLSSTAASPLCGSSDTAESQCQPSSLYATSGNTSVGTGTSAGTYQQLGSNVSLTTGTSFGAHGEWLVKINMRLNAAPSSGYVYGCLASASTYTLEDSTTDGASYCVTSSTNSFAGGPGFGETTSSGLLLNTLGRAQVISADVLVPNNSTFAVEGYVAGSSSTSTTVYGHIGMEAVWY